MNDLDFKKIRDQQSIMNKKLDGQSQMLNEHSKKLDGLEEKVDKQGKTLKAVFDHVGDLTVDMVEIKENMKSQTALLKKIATVVERNSDDNKKLNRRLTYVERNSGIIPPPELTIID